MSHHPPPWPALQDDRRHLWSRLAASGPRLRLRPNEEIPAELEGPEPC